MALKPYKSERKMMRSFGGVNKLKNAPPSDFSNMKNLSAEEYPFVTVRGKRGSVKDLTKPNGFGALEELYYVDGTGFFYNNVKKGDVADNEKQIVNSGADILIFPDKVKYNIANGGWNYLEKTFTQSSTVTVSVSKKDGTVYSGYTVGPTPPATPIGGDMWIDTSGNFDVMKIYSEETELWVSFSTTYFKIECTGINTDFSQFDGVTISGLTDNDLNMDYVIQYAGLNYIILYGLLRTGFTQETGFQMKRTVPDLNYVTEFNNRIWGCSNTNHEIYASKLGDSNNWNVFEGISTDSYAVTIASAGYFTGAISFGGYVMFFKEDCIHRIFGNKPSNFEVNEVSHSGVKSGCSKSLAIVNGVLYYLSINGVMAYSGGYPDCISDKLGNLDGYTDAVGCGFGDKYYLSMQDPNNMWHLYVYDTRKRTWHIEDNTHLLFASYLKDEVYMLDSDGTIITVNGSKGTKEGDIEWYGETGIFGLETPDGKYIGRIQLRVDVENANRFASIGESTFNLDIQYNSNGEWINTAQLRSSTLRSYTVPVAIRRCDHFKLRMSGKGEFTLFSIALETFEGGMYATL